MSGNPIDLADPTLRFLEREKSRLVDELLKSTAKTQEIAGQLATIDRDLAEYHRIAAKAAKYALPTTTDDVDVSALISPPIPATAAPPVAANRTPLTGRKVEMLVDLFRSSENYKALQFTTRMHYDNCLKPVVSSWGVLPIAEVNAAQIQRAYDDWTEHGTIKLPMAHGAITTLRILANFGLNTFNDPECDRLAVVLHRMRFPAPKSRTERLTKKQALNIIEMAHHVGLPSIAFTQALQYECGLSQKDLLGEWIPENEAGVAILSFMHEKWVHGICWDQIDANYTLRHVTSAKGHSIEIKLRDFDLVSRELDRIGSRPWSGPVIVSEKTGRPWAAGEFRRQWRKIATACEIPSNVKNMDSRGSAADEDNAGPTNEDEPKLRLVK